ncbi:MAG: transposase, partial [Pseudomonadota bacterium]|nr:transposase [Pseudomonadota bacterium]
MNVLPLELQAQIIASLCDGLSIRSVERLTGVHRDTIMRLGVRIGQGCEHVHDGLMQNLQPAFIELDETWAYVGKKQRKVNEADGSEVGDHYTFIGMDAVNKTVISYRVGKRTSDTTWFFVHDLRKRIVNAPQISSDAFAAYKDIVTHCFGESAHYGQIVKRFAGDKPVDAARRYSPGYVVAVNREKIFGKPKQSRIGTSHVERLNLSLRMGQRRFTRLTSGFSKKLVNHKAAVGLFMAHYNFCRVHESLGMSPAMASGVADHVWSIIEL